jgi:dUTP pyrophosphatase
MSSAPVQSTLGDLLDKAKQHKQLWERYDSRVQEGIDHETERDILSSLADFQFGYIDSLTTELAKAVMGDQFNKYDVLGSIRDATQQQASGPAVPLTVKFTLDNGGAAPTKAHSNDAAWDVYATTVGNWTLFPITGTMLFTGLHMHIPAGWYGKLETRSSMAADGVIVVGGIIDSGYTGEIMVTLANIGRKTVHIAPGDRIAQLLILPVPPVAWEQVDALEKTPRGGAGFGSSGK